MARNSFDLRTNKQSENVLAAIYALTQDSSVSIRAKVYSYLTYFSSKQVSQTLRRKAVSILVHSWQDNQASGPEFAATILPKFSKDDFSSVVKDSLAILLTSIPQRYGDLARLCGYLDLQNVAATIDRHLQEGKIKSRAHEWDARLALCRLGDERALEFVMQKVKNRPLGDDLIDAVFSDLIYTRHSKVLEYMISLIVDEEAGCQSSNPEFNESLPCAVRIIELLSPVVINFPIKVDSNGDLLATDVNNVVQKTREWLREGKARFDKSSY